MERTIKNKVVVVTGGASGIGFNIVDIFVKYGAKFAIIIDINEELGNTAVKNINKRYGRDIAAFFKCDVTSDLEDIFESISTKYKYVDVLVNNAGIADDDSIRKLVNINVTSLMEWSMKFYDHMRRDRNGNGGTIINIASIYGLRITPFGPMYNASKFAVVGFTKSLGHVYNFQRSGVRVIVVCPGFTYTQLTKNVLTRYEDADEDLIKHAKSNEWQEVEAVGEGVKKVFEKADSGTVWIIEGGRQPVIYV